MIRFRTKTQALCAIMGMIRHDFPLPWLEEFGQVELLNSVPTATNRTSSLLARTNFRNWGDRPGVLGEGSYTADSDTHFAIQYHVNDGSPDVDSFSNGAPWRFHGQTGATDRTARYVNFRPNGRFGDTLNTLYYAPLDVPFPVPTNANFQIPVGRCKMAFDFGSMRAGLNQAGRFAALKSIDHENMRLALYSGSDPNMIPRASDMVAADGAKSVGRPDNYSSGIYRDSNPESFPASTPNFPAYSILSSTSGWSKVTAGATVTATKWGVRPESSNTPWIWGVLPAPITAEGEDTPRLTRVDIAVPDSFVDN